MGFDDLGNTDDFSTARLEYRLIETGISLSRLMLRFFRSNVTAKDR